MLKQIVLSCVVALAMAGTRRFKRTAQDELINEVLALIFVDVFSIVFFQGIKVFTIH